MSEHSNQHLKMPVGKKQVDEIVEGVTNLMEDTQRLAGALSETMPKVGEFLKGNWKPIASMATLGLTAYVILRSSGRVTPTHGKLHAPHAH